MDDTAQQLRRLAHAAAETPGRVVTGYAAGDREALQKLADGHRRQADRLDQAARDTP